jgi:hypothetical protein
MPLRQVENPVSTSGHQSSGPQGECPHLHHPSRSLYSRNNSCQWIGLRIRPKIQDKFRVPNPGMKLQCSMDCGPSHQETFGFCLHHIASVFMRLKSVIIFFAQKLFHTYRRLSKPISVKSKQNLFDYNDQILVKTSVGDPDPHDFGPPKSGSISQRYGSGSLPFLTLVLRGLKKCLQNKIFTQNFRKKLNFLRLKIMCPRLSCKKKNMKNFFSPEERSWIRIQIRIH